MNKNIYISFLYQPCRQPKDQIQKIIKTMEDNSAQRDLGSNFSGNSEVKLESGVIRNGRSKAVKVEQPSDIFTRSFSNMYEKKQTKKEEGIQTEESQVPKKVSSRKILTYCPSRANSVSIPKQFRVTSTQDNNVEEFKPLQNAVFQQKHIWDPQRNLNKEMAGDSERPVAIQNLKPLPQNKHQLNKPKDYHPIGEPQKKKQYRPVVPRDFKTGYDTFLERRTPKKVTDLGVFSIDEVVQFCYNEILLPIDITTIFLNKSGTKQILKDFSEKWLKGDIHTYNFKDHPFTLIDHRRLSELLLHFFPQRYTIGATDGFHINQKQYFYRIHQLNAEDYVKLYLTIDSISSNTSPYKWWEQLKQRYIGTIHEQYFAVKEMLNHAFQPPSDLSECSRLVQSILGPLSLNDNEKELEKILTDKFKNRGRPIAEDMAEFGEQERLEDFQSGDYEETGQAVDDSSRRNPEEFESEEQEEIQGEVGEMFG